MGSECTGKTTLARALAAHYKVEFAAEFLRNYFDEKQGNLTVDDAVPIARGQLDLEQHLAEKGYNPIICDTDIISSIVYTKHYFKKCPDQLEQKLYKLPRGIYLLCDIDIPWQNDGQRDMPHKRQYMQNLFIKELRSRNIPFHILSGPLDNRLKKSITIVDKALSY